MPSTYTVDPSALADSAPKFDAIAGDVVAAAKGVEQQASSLCGSLGDPAVVTAVGSAITTLLDDLRLVHGGVQHLGAGVAQNAQSYLTNEQSTSSAYRQAGRPAADAP